MADYRDNNFTELQLRGLEIVFNLTKKKFPWITNFTLADDYKDYVATLYVNIYFNGEELSNQLKGLYKLKTNNLYTKESVSLFPFFESENDEDSPSRHQFFEKLNQEINETLKFYYIELPEEAQIFWFSELFTVAFPVRLAVSKYILD